MTKRKLLVLVPDRLSALITKGEITDRYYNPGDLFDEVHILMTNADKPDSAALGPTVGRATLQLHNLPFTALNMIATFGARPALLRGWAGAAVELAEKIRPTLMRVHGDGLNGFAAAEIKMRLGIPYVLSLHQNPDEKLDTQPSFTQRLLRKLLNAARRDAIQGADVVVPVYQSSVAYARRMGARRIEVIYNIVGSDKLIIKKDYGLHKPIRLLSVGRHFESKNPSNIIRAIQEIPETELTLVGDGPLQEGLEQLVRQLKLGRRVRFVRSISNAELCSRLHEYDLFTIHVENDGISKTTLEAMLAGLPCVINKRNGNQVSELQGEHVLLVENSPEGYAAAIRALIADDAKRQRLGEMGLKYAREHWAPENMERKYVGLYKELIGNSK